MNITITSGPEVDLMGWSLLRTRCVWFATWPGSSRGTETASKKCFQTVLTKFWLDYPTTPLKHYLSVHSPSPLPIPVCKGQISSMGWGAVVKLPLHNNGHSPDPFFLCLFVIWEPHSHSSGYLTCSCSPPSLSSSSPFLPLTHYCRI